MHIAEKGEEGNPVVLFLHGFPELWYSWRHQILSLSAHGYRAIAPDLRGFGDTDAPPSSESYTVFHIVGDLIALIDTLGLQQVFVVGHDWGAVIAWYFCLFRPDRVKALVNLSVPFRPRHPSRKPVASMRAMFGVIATVLFFWIVHKTDFFPKKFGVRSIRNNEDERNAALYLQVSIVSQALIFVTRSRSWSYTERPGLMLCCAFLIAQLIATLLDLGVGQE